jgi:hypothetical protein
LRGESFGGYRKPRILWYARESRRRREQSAACAIVNRTEEEAAQSHESDGALGAEERGENQIAHNSGDISNGRENVGARCPANEEDSFPSRLSAAARCILVIRVSGQGECADALDKIARIRRVQLIFPDLQGYSTRARQRDALTALP